MMRKPFRARARARARTRAVGVGVLIATLSLGAAGGVGAVEQSRVQNRVQPASAVTASAVRAVPAAAAAAAANDGVIPQWSPTGHYNAGDQVQYEGRVYTALSQHRGNGDPGWIDAPSLWTPSATPRKPVEAVTHSSGALSAAIGLKRDAGDQVVFRTITLQPNAGTGKHCHAGQLVATVRRGELTHYAPIYDKGVHVYKQGDVIIEGPGYVHEGKNLGTADLVLDVLYLIGAGQPLAQQDLSKCDAE